MLCLAGASLAVYAQTDVEGKEYYKADQLDNAKELLERSLSNPATNKAVSNYYLGMIAADNKNNAEAGKYFNAGISDNPNYAYNYVGLGLLDLIQKNEKAADANFKLARKFAGKDPSIEIALASAYNDVDPVKYEKQISKCVDKARRQNSSNPDIYVFEGDRLRAKKDIGGAAAQYEMAVSNDPNESAAYVKYANLFTMVNPDYAIKMLKDLLNVNPQSALGQRELANAYYNAKDFTNAASEYGRYVNNPSHFKKDEDRYAFLLFYGQNYQEGYNYATKLLKENPNNFTAQRFQFMNAAQLENMKDMYLTLAEALYAAHNANPATNKFAAIDYTLIADELSKAKRGDEAIAVLNEAMAEMPENASFDKQLAMTYVDMNNLTKAAESYKGYLAKIENPNYNDYIQQATFSFYAGVENVNNPEVQAQSFNDATEYAEKAQAAYPGHYKPLKMKGDIAKQTADKDHISSAAVPMYTEAITLLEASENPARYASDAKEMYNYMGNYWLDQKDVNKAKEFFNKYLQYDPNNDAYRQFVEGLK